MKARIGAERMAGRRIGSLVKLTVRAGALYPELRGRVGKIVKRDILTHGHGLGRGYPARYTVAYYVRFAGDKYTTYLGANHLTGA